jgi:hypothetical protein
MTKEQKAWWIDKAATVGAILFAIPVLLIFGIAMLWIKIMEKRKPDA